jgi:polyhydroxybutyrate depolymerase
MNWIKRILYALLMMAVFVVGLFFYYVYVPAPDKPALAGQLMQSEMNVSPLNRTYSWYRPSNAPNNAPLVFILHGSLGSGDGMRTGTAYEFDVLADQYGFIAVYPDGYQRHWNDCRSSADYAANTDDIDDVAFFEAMIDVFVAQEQVDRKRIFVTGISNGGHMAYKLALEIPERFAAVAPMAANLPVDDTLDCHKSGQPISIAIFNGTDDPVNPYDGGLVELFGNASRGVVLSSELTAKYWRDLAGISQPASVKTFPEVDGLADTSVTQLRWSGENGLEVRLYTLQGSGHVIPSKIAKAPRIIGIAAADISGPAEIVDFFLSLGAP